jgi:hypothetical protein
MYFGVRCKLVTTPAHEVSIVPVEIPLEKVRLCREIYTLILRNMPRFNFPTMFPCRLNQVSLLKM